ncbi:hypothetical protein PV05_08833 [Exophiala xenobiotica]|uniref:Uncharacterized protein n=1 Tax=Exophiala xenobiotica TaxID=348802 RepID=A0A0D2EZS6_9EURO|nr:uncharacterized protein PV05_08833 [Exophiala xenobiotica]KIW53244.1 hypothetical protein PV05_08833 [Exophiala xenobiotica]
MATGRNHPPPNANAFMQDGQLDSSFRSWQSRRPQLFHQSGSVVRMPANTQVRISVIADDQEDAVKLSNTLYDGTLQKSLISKAKAVATSGSIRASPLVILADHTGQTHSSSATISLRWYYDDGLQTFKETFYIVDKLPRPGPNAGEWDAILRTGVEPSPADGPANAFPYMTVPPRRDSGAEQERRKQAEIRQKQYEAEKAAQAAKIRKKLLEQAAKR